MTTATQCCVYKNCKNSKRLHPNLTFFTFPTTNNARLRTWLINSANVKLLDFTMEKLSRKLICEKHFNEKYITGGGFNRRKLLVKHAVPINYYFNMNEDIPHQSTSSSISTEKSHVQPVTHMYENKMRAFEDLGLSLTDSHLNVDVKDYKSRINQQHLRFESEKETALRFNCSSNEPHSFGLSPVADKVNTPPVVKVEVSAESCLNDDLPGPSYESEQDPLQVPAVKSNIMVKPKITVLKKLRKIYVTKDGRPAMPSKNQRRDDLNKSALPLLVIRSPGSLGVPRLLFKEKQPTVSAIANVPTRNEPTSTMANVPTRNEPTSTIMNAVARGNRIVDIQQVLERLQAISCHNLSNGCTLGDVRVCSEHSEGLLSELRLHCDRCGTDFTLALASSVDNNGQVTDLNSAAVARTTSAGLTHRQLIDLLTALGIPNVVTDTFTEEMFNDINAMQKANKDNTIFIKEEPFDIDIKEELF